MMSDGALEPTKSHAGVPCAASSGRKDGSEMGASVSTRAAASPPRTVDT